MILRKYSPRDKTKCLFASVRDDFLATCRKRRLKGELSYGYMEDIESAFRLHYGFLNGLDVEDITAGTIDEWLELSDAPPYRKSVMVKYLFLVLRHAQKREHIKALPVKPTIQSERKPHEWLTDEQQAEVLGHIHEGHKPIFEMGVAMGIRWSEIRALRVQDISFSRGVVTITSSFDRERLKNRLKTKKKTGAEYPLARVASIIRRSLAGRVYGPDDFVFVHKDDKGAWAHYSHSLLSDIFKRAVSATGYKVKLNELSRHSMASKLFNAGATGEEVAAVLNNTSGTATRHYIVTSAARRGKIYDIATPENILQSVAIRRNKTKSKR